MTIDSIDIFVATGHPHVHGAPPQLPVWVANHHLSVAAITAAEDGSPASSVLRVPAEGPETSNWTSLTYCFGPSW